MRNLLAALILVTGCNNAGLGDGADAGPPPSGVYQASSTILSNDCSVSPAALQGEQGIGVKNGDVFVLSDPQTNVDGTVIVARYDVSGGAFDAKTNDCGAGRELLLQVTHADARSLDASYTVTWTSNHSVTQADCGVPADDCSSVVTTHFELLTACQPPCTVAEMLPGQSYSCQCPQ